MLTMVEGFLKVLVFSTRSGFFSLNSNDIGI